MTGAVTEQLRDIRGLDAIPWWPPAPGWWLLFGLALLLAVGGAAWYRAHVRASWQSEAERLLSALRKGIHDTDTHAAAGSLSELLRRIAMVRFGRRACAGLTGEDWLAWLEARDPNRFPWRSKGWAIIDWPYAPPQAVKSPATLRPLIGAARAWIEAEAPSPRGWLGQLGYFKVWRRYLAARRGAPAGGVGQHV